MKICKDCKHCHNPWYFKIFNSTPDCYHEGAHRYKSIITNPVTGVQKERYEYYANCVYERCFGECGPKGKNFKIRIYNEIKKAS